MSHRVLVVEEEEKLARFMELELKYEGYDVSVARDGLRGFTQAQEFPPDLIIVDGALPGMSGLELCRRLREMGSRIPIILITAKDDVEERVLGLDAGADDYIVKPFNSDEFFARIRVQLRRTHTTSDEVLQFADLRFNRSTREIQRGDRLIDLTAKEFELLDYLLSHARQVLTREQILERVWGYDFMGDSNIIEVYIRYLRLKLEAAGEPRLIQTVRGVGYVLRD
jgi:two-component system OmpR family response regulator